MLISPPHLSITFLHLQAKLTLSCVDTSGTANLVQWINSTGTVLTFSSSNAVTLTFASVSDQHHGVDYICRIHSPGVTHDLNYTIIVLGE